MERKKFTMRSLKEKLKKQGGFTLVEMLIVVAIIAILIAVSIPIVSYSLESARHSTDAANERAAKAEILITKMANDAEMSGDKIETDKGYVYDAAKGKVFLASTDPTVAGYGKHGSHKGQILGLKLTDDNEVIMSWYGSVSAAKDGPGSNGKLCGQSESASTCPAK